MGKYLVNHLLKTGKHSITAITRSDSTNKIPEGVTIKKVDYSSKDSLTDALKGQDCLIITLAVSAPPDSQRQIIETAAAAGVPWILPNEWGGDDSSEALNRDTMIGIAKKKDRDYIEELGVSSWIGIACSFWYEFSIAGGEPRYGFDLKKKEVTLFDDGTTPLNTTTWDQVARAVSALLSFPVEKEAGYDGPVVSDWRKRFVCISSFTISQRDMLDSLNRVMGMTDAEWKIRHEPAQERFQRAAEALKKGDMTAFPTMLYSRLFFPGESLKFEERQGLANGILGLPKEDLDDRTRFAVQMDKDGYFSGATGRR